MSREDQNFKRAVILSVSAHLAVFVFVVISPYLPKGKHKGMVNYVPVTYLGGGGGGGTRNSGGSPPPPKTESQLAETAVPPRESLKDLTTPQNLQQKKPPAMTYPVEKPKRDRTPKKPKKTSIKKAPPKSSTSQKTAANKPGGSSGTEAGSGSGFQVGIGDGSGEGPGFGPGYGSSLSLTGFNYPWYLQTIMNQSSSNWLTAQIRSGVKEDVRVVVRFKIFRDGHISEPEIAQSSGIRTMDASAIRAVRNSTFPPLPHDFEGEYIQINLIFQHTK